MKRKVRWECPNGHAGVLGPSRPRRDDVCRYCLACSAEKGRLVLRCAPALVRKLEKLIVTRQKKLVAMKTRHAERTALYYTVAGLNLHTEMLAMLSVPAFEGLRKLGTPRLQIRRASTRPQRFGTAWWYSNRIQVVDFPGVTVELVRETLMHEIAHLAAPRAGHGTRWRTVFRLACEQHFGVRPIVEKRYVGEVAAMLTARNVETSKAADQLAACNEDVASMLSRGFAMKEGS